MQMRFISYLYSSEDNLFDLLCLIGTINRSDLQALQPEADRGHRKVHLTVSFSASILNGNSLQTFVSELGLGMPLEKATLQHRLDVDFLSSFAGQLNLGLALRILLCDFLISPCTLQ